MKIKSSLLMVLIMGIVPTLQAATSSSDPQWNILLGITQPLLFGGGNVEVNYVTDKWVFEYSHGFNLDLNSMDGVGLTEIEKNKQLSIFVPYSTGGGIGYRFTKEFNLRVEFKQHEFQVTNRNGEQIKYTNQDLGLGAYYFYQPFNNNNLIIVPSVRYWPTMSTSLKKNKYTFSNGDVHEAHEFGLFANVSIGWKF